MKLVILLAGFICHHCAYSQNVGIGTSTPFAPLHVKSSLGEILRLESINPYISFFNGTTYKGYIWHDGTRMELGSTTNEPVVINANFNSFPAFFTPSGRLGLGISNPIDRLDVNGGINFTGLLRINGNIGAVGQILTSNGPLDPTWSNAALSNNIRFAVDLIQNAGGIVGDTQIGATRYNLNPAEVVIGASSITINRSGLYHFDLSVIGQVVLPTAPAFTPNLMILFYYGLFNPYKLVPEMNLQPTSTANISWRGGTKVSLEIYITAPATVRIHHTFAAATGFTSYSLGGSLTGHLISE